MRKLIVIIVLFVAVATVKVNAQTPKFGHIDMTQLIQVMPERALALGDLEKEAGDLEEMLGTMQEELQTMYEEYTTKLETMSDLVRQAKEEDIQMKQQRIETFRMQADQQLQQKQQQLMEPILEKADNAIAEVAKENNLLYVFDVSSRVVLYQSNQSVDVLPLVKKKLGIE
ncbi:MAG: OmpH family outer membrane protein [Prolixibacteraceae bacterium]|nr:OmpH family outer membrane protein [Prolixibacteraceae bacterium]MBN2649949.1 OmpH family outer membrane protein [Prolixibacteraceae bacterium]